MLDRFQLCSTTQIQRACEPSTSDARRISVRSRPPPGPGTGDPPYVAPGVTYGATGYGAPGYITGRLDPLTEHPATGHRGLPTGHLPIMERPDRCMPRRQSMSSGSTPTHPLMPVNTCRGHPPRSPTTVAAVASSIWATVGGHTAIEATPRERERAVPARLNDIQFSRPAQRAVAQWGIGLQLGPFLFFRPPPPSLRAVDSEVGQPRLPGIWSQPRSRLQLLPSKRRPPARSRAETSADQSAAAFSDRFWSMSAAEE